jgi:hypothetical protein
MYSKLHARQSCIETGSDKPILVPMDEAYDYLLETVS